MNAYKLSSFGLSFSPLILVFVPKITLVWLRNSTEARPEDLFWTLAAWAGVGLLLYVLLWPVYRCSAYTGVASSLVLFAAINTGRFLVLFGNEPQQRRIGLTTIAIMATLSIAAVRSLPRNAKVESQVLRTAIHFLLCIALVNLIFASIPSANQLHFEVKTAPIRGLPPDSEKPNIIYIVPDTLARADVLHKYYGIDTLPFLDFFRSEGFFVPSESRSNYPVTAFSMSSALNMGYLVQTNPNAQVPPGYEHEDCHTVVIDQSLNRLVHANRLARILNEAGYKVINVYGGIGYTANFDTTSNSVGYHNNDFSYAIASDSIFGHFFDKWPGLSPYPAAKRKCIRVSFSEVRRIARTEEGPYFLVAHSMAAHPPFIFMANGEPVNPWRPESNKGYAEQATYVLKELVETSKAIIGNNRPTVIIIQSDHGGHIGELSVNNPASKLRFANFCAIRLPGGQKTPPNLFPQDLSPVQTFPILLNHLFRADIPVPESRSYWGLVCRGKFKFEKIQIR